MKSFIKSIGTAVPSFKTDQKDLVRFMAETAEMKDSEEANLHLLYRATGISKRYSVIPDFGLPKSDYTFFPRNDFLNKQPTIEKRMQLFKEEALPLSIQAIQNCISKIDSFDKHSITHLILVSCTGMYAPGLDIEIIQSLNLNSNIKRTNIHFMGCYAAFNALKAADSICKSEKDASVLIVCVELCTIHFRPSKLPDQILANALFSDGAAATIVQSNQEAHHLFSIENFYCDLLPQAKQEMTWDIGSLGFEMQLSQEVPEHIRNGIAQLTNNLLKDVEGNISDIDYLAVHPGGKKILDVVESSLNINREKNKFSHEVLREFGNMSSCTILFILENIALQLHNEINQKSILSFAFGPGLTMESMSLKSNGKKRAKAIIANTLNESIQ